MTDSEQRILAWHFLPADGRLNYGDGRLVVPGETLSVEGEPVLCEHGLHASERLIDALSYAPSSLVERVEVWGRVKRGTDTLDGQHRHCLWTLDIDRLLHEFALWCAEGALNRERAAGREPDPRSWAALEAKRGWLAGTVSDAELDAARAAAWDAVGAAAWAAAWDAASDSAWDAARAAANDSAWSAAKAATRDNARAAVMEMQNTELERRVLALRETVDV